MSTVDAAIINYIIGGGGSSGGGGGSSGGGSSDVAQRLENEYGIVNIDCEGGGSEANAGILTFNSKTRGVGVALMHKDQLAMPFAIRADSGSNYPELIVQSPNFSLTATKHGQTGKSLTTLKSADFYTEGNLTVKEGFTFSAPNVYTKQEVDTMFASGGNKDEDTMTKLTSVANLWNSTDGYVPSGGVWWMFIGIPKKSFRTGLIIKMYNNRSNELESYVLIRKSDDLNQDLGVMKEDLKPNGSLVSLTSNRVIAVYIGQRDFQLANNSNAIIFAVALNTYDEATDSNGGGVFEVDHMSHSTLVKIACNYHTTGDQSV